MALRLHNKNETPPGGFRFWVEERRCWLPAKGSYSNYAELRAGVLACLKANGLPVVNIDDRIQDQVCKALGPDHCASDEARLWRRVATAYQQFVEGTGTLARLVVARAQGDGLVGQAEAEKRAEVCTGCEYNRPPGECPTCSSNTLLAAVKAVIGDRRTKLDAQLGGCGMCGCGLRAKVHVTQGVLKGATSDIPYPVWCWMKTETGQL